MPTEPDGHRRRILAFVVLFACLTTILVWGGTVTPDPATNNYPDEDDIGPTPEAHVGQQVTLDGTVVATDPVVVRIDYAGHVRETTVENVDRPVAEGQDITAFGTLTDPSTLDVETALVRSPWELWYMYAVSFLGALLVGSEYRRHAFVLLALGAASHHALDLLLLNPSGFAYPVLWPLTEYHPPAGMLYRSSDRWPAVVATIAAVAVRALARRAPAGTST